ncbi:MAG TPA: phytoene/squalene synthase family protein, partial [Ktedonobacteraceae bacterium]|nr:phytoene/squalene synthase family protein [Ktedonobacteraceae bacterium]
VRSCKMSEYEDVMETLRATSRTFFIPIFHLPPGLQEAVASAYLCMRAVDEIEDHAELGKHAKIRQLRSISQILQAQSDVETFTHDEFTVAFSSEQDKLPSVTLRLAEWACYAPKSIAPRIWDTTAAMAERMAYWVGKNWKIKTEADLNSYTYSVAGSIGLLLCDIWAWFAGEQLSRSHALHFGRGLQAVNILRNRVDDLARGVDFFPNNWTWENMYHYAYQQLSLAEAYTKTIASDSTMYFIKIPLALAYATLDALKRGEAKLSREEVLHIVQDINNNE